MKPVVSLKRIMDLIMVALALCLSGVALWAALRPSGSFGGVQIVIFIISFFAIGNVVRSLRRPTTQSLASQRKATEAAIAAMSNPVAGPGYRHPALSSPQGEAVYQPILATAPLPQLNTLRRGAHGIQLRPSKAKDDAHTIVFMVLWNIAVIPMIPITLWSALTGESKGPLIGTAMGVVFFAFGCVFWVPIAKRAIANIKLPRIEIATEPVLSGAPVDIHVSHRAWGQLNTLEIHVVCAEIVSFSEGTTRRVEEHELMRLPAVVEQNLRAEAPLHHVTRVTIPDGVPHSFESAHNALEWSVRVHADVPNWPDYSERFVFRVLPKPIVTS